MLYIFRLYFMLCILRLYLMLCILSLYLKFIIKLIFDVLYIFKVAVLNLILCLGRY